MLYHNDGKANVTDETRTSRIGSESSYTSWGARIVDLDNDGYPDISLVTGSDYPKVENRLPQYPNKSQRIVFRNMGDGTFEESRAKAGPGVATPHSSHGCAFEDFDNDGDLDILIVNMNEVPSLLRNDMQEQNHWIKIKLIGTVSNRSASGARVVTHYGGKTQAQTLASQSSYSSSNDPRLHFGLGSNECGYCYLLAEWCDGPLEDVAADHLIAVVKGKGITSWQMFDRTLSEKKSAR